MDREGDEEERMYNTTVSLGHCQLFLSLSLSLFFVPKQEGSIHTRNDHEKKERDETEEVKEKFFFLYFLFAIQGFFATDPP